MQKVCIYERVLSVSRKTRTNGMWFGKPTIMRQREFQENTYWFCRATVSEKSLGEAKV